MQSLGIMSALLAFLGWGFGDFFIQRASRRVGVLTALFFIAAFGGIFLFPFVWMDLPRVFNQHAGMLILTIAALTAFFTSLFDFAALKQGKIAIIEPIIALELPITIGLSVFLLREHLSPGVTALIFGAFVGIVLAITGKPERLRSKDLFERGVMLAGVGALGMALSNITIGLSSQQNGPLVAIWFVHSSLAVFCLLVMAATGEIGSLGRSWRENRLLLTAESVLDTGAWVAYAYAVLFVPISIATTISQSYTVLAVLLGLVINKEKVRAHQVLGVVLAIVCVLTLSYLYQG